MRTSRRFVNYWWTNFKSAVHDAKEFYEIVGFLFIVFSAISAWTWGAEWQNYQIVQTLIKYASTSGAVLLLLCFLLIPPFRRHESLEQYIQQLKNENNALLAQENTAMEEQQTFAETLLGTVRFDYLPETPLNNGWSVSPGSAGTCKFSAPTDEEGQGGIVMTADRTFAMDAELPAVVAHCEVVRFAARYEGPGAAIYARINVSSRDGSQHDDKWLAFVEGTAPPRPYGDGTKEWAVYLSGTRLGNGWANYSVPLSEAVRQTFASEGFVFRGLRAIRLRGRLSISAIEFLKNERASVIDFSAGAAS